MKRHILIILSFLLLWGFSINQRSQWKGKIEEEDGVKVIKNPLEPLYGEITFELEKDLSIGKRDNEMYRFSKVRNVAVDREGNIYVVDMNNNRIQVFDEQGIYVQTIGKKGEGKGEFMGRFLLGTLAAWRGDREEALRISLQLEKMDIPYHFGGHTYWRARIAALLGEKELAVRLLREAHAQGLNFYGFHNKMDFEPLNDYPPFVEFMKPKG